MTVTSRLARLGGTFAASLLALAIQSASASTTEAPVSSAPTFTNQQVSNAYIYLLGRLLIMRQQQLDFQQGMTWNQWAHRKPGAVEWPNPNLDVAYSEAWVAVDERSCTELSVPKITGRYYTVQLLNGWGETLVNINERAFADHPYGEFAVCLKDAKVDLPADTRRIDLPVRTARVLSRLELGDDRQVAEQLQHRFTMRPTGSPQLPPVPDAPMFELFKLPGVEAFDTASLALQEPDINPGMDKLQAQVKAIAEEIRQPGGRARIDQQIRTHAFAALANAAATIGPGIQRNGWVRPAVSGAYGDDYLTRTLIDLGGIWANTGDEVTYFRGARDSEGQTLDGGQSYTMTFPRDQLPSGFARYYWSVTAVNSKTFRVLPNSLDRFLLNRESGLHYNADGSLTLYFGPQLPKGGVQANWLPTVAGETYRLMLRYYGAQGPVASGEYFPPALVRL